MTNSIKSEREVLVTVEGVSKKFCKDLKKSLRYGVIDIAKDLFGITNKPILRKSEFWAVKDVSFELRRGDCLGIIGHNGAGKSTLLKILNGLLKPEEGEIMMKGKVQALINLGAGFNNILTGRENVFNYGVLLGFTHKEILSMYQEIVEFAEMEDFMETPVQSYSSGMKVRLGFAVAAQMKPDILIVDEVLAVGDIGFRKKCFDKMGQLRENTTIILVSHSIPKIARFCDRIILMDHGKLEIDSKDLSKAIEQYYKKFETGLSKNIGNKIILKNIIYNGIDVLNSVMPVEYGSSFEMILKFELKTNLNKYQIGLIFLDTNQNPIAGFQTDTYSTGSTDTQTQSICIDQINFGTKRLSINIHFYRMEGESKELIQTIESACSIQTLNTPLIINAPIILSGK